MRSWKRRMRLTTLAHPLLCQHVQYMFNTEARSDLQNALFDYLHVLTCIFCDESFFFFVFINIYLSSFVYALYLNSVTWHIKKVSTLVSWNYIYSLRNYRFLSFQLGTTKTSVKTEFSFFHSLPHYFPSWGLPCDATVGYCRCLSKVLSDQL